MIEIADKGAFLDHKKKLTVELIDGNNKIFDVKANIPVGVYYKALALTDLMRHEEDVYLQMEIAAEIIAVLLSNEKKQINQDWVFANITPKNQADIIYLVMTEVQKLIDNEVYQIPEIKVVKKNNHTDSEYKKRQKEIERLKELLTNKMPVYLINDLVLVMSKTGNTYNQIMEMPILVFKDIVRSIVINESRTDDDYNLAYLKYERNKIKDKINKEAYQPEKKQGADVKGLKALLGQ